MTSTIDSTIPPLKPTYEPRPSSASRDEPPHLASLIKTLNLEPHIEGGYFVETDRDTYRVPNPFLASTNSASTNSASASQATSAAAGTEEPSNATTFYTSTGAVSADLSNNLTSADREIAREDAATEGRNRETRNASTSIHYLLTPQSNLGAFHRNKGRTIHTLHSGRGRYVIIHADEVMPAYDTHHGIRSKARVETFVVGRDVEKGERLQWVVEGGKYKASFLLEGEVEGKEEEEGLLISETVVPGFEYSDHDFMRVERLEALVNKDQAEEMRWLLRRDDKPV